MELHEYQVKLLLARFGVASPPHVVIELGTPLEPPLSKFGIEPFLVKAQVHGRGRREGGGERLVAKLQELPKAVKSLLGTRVITSASGPQGFSVSKVMVMSVPSIVKEFQCKIFLTSAGDVEVCVCQKGGKTWTEHPFEGFFRPFQLNRLAAGVGIRGAEMVAFKKVLEGIVNSFFYFDALLIEIESLAVTEDGIFQALDARMVIDDNALYRQPEISHMMDSSQTGARVNVLPCICLDMGGQIGCVSNGMGLALSTADLIRLFEGVPGKVVNIGRDIVEDRLSRGLKMMQKERQKVVCVNLFTGLVDAEKVARVLKKEVSQIPMVVRLEGTNAGEGRLLLKGLEPRCIVAESLDDAAQRAAVIAARGF